MNMKNLEYFATESSWNLPSPCRATSQEQQSDVINLQTLATQLIKETADLQQEVTLRHKGKKTGHYIKVRVVQQAK